MKGTALLLLVLVIVSCGASRGRDHWKLTPEQKKVLTRIEGVLDADSCSNERRENCQFLNIKPEPRALPSVSDDVILLLDAQVKIPPLALHRSRVLAHYRVADAPDYYVPYEPSVKMPEGASHILHEVFKGNEEWASSKPFFELGTRFVKKYGKLMEGEENLGHGTTSFNILAELNPSVKFVIVHVDENLHRPPFCELAREGGIEIFNEYWNQKGEALARIAELYRVRWVNYSMGYDLQNLKRHWHEQCAEPIPSDTILRAAVLKTNELVRAFEKLPDLLFVQAAAYPSSYLDARAQKDFCADCERLSRRLRVGFLNLEEDELPLHYARNLSLLKGSQRNVVPCSDLFVRDGLIDAMQTTETPINFTATGFGHGPLNVPGTSYIAPVGLSYAAYWMKKKGFTPDQLLRSIRGPWDQPLLVAPFRKREFLNQNRWYVNWYEH